MFSDLLRLCSDVKESGVRKATGSYRTYSIPSKTAALVPEFAVNNLPFGQNSDDDHDDVDDNE